jgi:hypothetical protein
MHISSMGEVSVFQLMTANLLFNAAVKQQQR